MYCWPYGGLFRLEFVDAACTCASFNISVWTKRRQEHLTKYICYTKILEKPCEALESGATEWGDGVGAMSTIALFGHILST